ncbi:MAG: two-component sensor histidine kinase, partial [Myxococcaceae bacterium]|nr:two-component sensor histidine kinase [Myxococcaceae bacterium]
GVAQANRLEALVVLIGLLDLALAVVLAMVVLAVGLGAPLRRAAERAAVLLAGEGLRMTSGGAPGADLATAIDALATRLDAERTTNARRLAELSRSLEERTRLQAELVAADRLATVGKLAAGVAHEVGNPLSGILGYLSVLRRRVQGADSAELFDLVEAEVKRIDEIVRGLLEMGRPSRGKAQPLSIAPIVDACVRMVTSASEYQGVRVEVVCPPEVYLRAEAGPLAQVLVNLLLNAAQAMNGQGALRVVVESGDAAGTITVEDEGPGLAPEVLPKLFTPFFTTRPPGSGTGLGLAVSRHLLSQFDGRLEAGNREGGKGARFVITLPRP